MLRRGLLGLLAVLVALPCLGVVWGEDPCNNGAISSGGNSSFCIVWQEPEYNDNEVTFTYIVCGDSRQKGLSHWSFVPKIDCYATDDNGVPYTLRDLVVNATFQTWNGDEWSSENIKVVIGPDPTTGLNGIKFDDLEPKDDCHLYTITFDLSKLDVGRTLCNGWIDAATKAGNEDIRSKGKKSVSPGYAKIQGPCCDCPSLPPGPPPNPVN